MKHKLVYTLVYKFVGIVVRSHIGVRGSPELRIFPGCAKERGSVSGNFRAVFISCFLFAVFVCRCFSRNLFTSVNMCIHRSTCANIFQHVQKSVKMCRHLSTCAKHVKMCKHLSKCAKLCHHSSNSVDIYRYLSISVKICHNLSKYVNNCRNLFEDLSTSVRI